GCQFMNSQGFGRYGDYIAHELVEALTNDLPISPDPQKWILLGGSSGGYGALSLLKNYPTQFKKAFSLSPDSFFEVSLLPEIYKALPYIQSSGGCKNILSQFKKKELRLPGSLQFMIFNVVAMAHAYAPLNA